MDEEFLSVTEDVNSVLDQESSELLHILSRQSPQVLMELCQTMASGRTGLSEAARLDPDLDPGTLLTLVPSMLDYFRTARAAECRSFLQSVCMLCENIPMHLETRLMSVAGDATSGVTIKEPSLSPSPSPPSPSPPSPPSDQLVIKRPRIDHWEQYIAAVTGLLLKRWERLSDGLVKEVQLENVWVSLRTATRGRERPDQTPGPAGSRTPEPDGDFVSLEPRVTLETFLQGCRGKVTAVIGPAGSGKTLLMSCLGQQWARGFGPIPSSYLFVLLEFRQLNLLSAPLSLSELLFRHYLPAEGGDEEKRAVVDYLISNPEQSCWVLDGYDEFSTKLGRHDANIKPLDPNKQRVPVKDLVSALLNRQLLPGCTVLVTCRTRDVGDLDGVVEKVVQLLAWDANDVKEYVDNFFGGKGDSTNQALRTQAVNLLLSSRHLLAMSSLPALCNICCICLKHLLLENNQEGADVQEGTRSRVKRQGSDDSAADGTNGRSRLQPPTPAHIPSTRTQVYLTVLGAFLSRDPERTEPQKPSQRHVSLSQYGSVLRDLTQLAWKGLEESKILFRREEFPPNVLEFSLRTGLLSQVELRLEDGKLISVFCFLHLTVQEFLAALRIMTCSDVSDAQLKKRFSLRTRWTTKSDQRTVFTDSLHLYLCGLASQHCTQHLVQLAKPSGAQTTWVQKRQTLVLNLLSNLCNSNTLTGPKILELCHCVQESQDQQLAKRIVGTRPTLELRNIWLLPNDIDALAFVVNSVGDAGVGLDFGACSMELECLDDLTKCRYIRCLSFRSRKYGDKFADKLSSVLSEFKTLRKLEFCGSSLTSTGAASLASALEKCTEITEINLSDNSLKDDGIEHIADIFIKLPKLTSVLLSRNNSSVNAVDYLIGKLSSSLNVQHVHADAMKELKVTFFSNSDVDNSNKTKPAPTISLLNQKWDEHQMRQVASSLCRCPVVSVLDLSGGQWDVVILATLIEFLPKFNVTDRIVLNDSCSSVDGLVALTSLVSARPDVVDLHVRLRSDPDPVQVSITFSGRRKTPEETSKTLRLSCCNLLHNDLDKVWRSLGSGCDLTMLDLSSNSLGNKGLKKVLDFLPRLQNIQEINVSNNNITMEGVVTLAAALSSSNALTQIHISDGGKQKVILKFCSDKSDDENRLKIFRVNNSSLLPSDVATLCRKLSHCRSGLELDLSHSSLKDEAIRSFLRVLPKMTSLQKLNVSSSVSSTAAALTLLSCLTVSQRVASLELRPRSECVVRFDGAGPQQTSCSLTDFSLNSDDLQSLVEILQQSPGLSDLDLSSSRLDDDGLKHLVGSLPKLKINGFINLNNHSLSQQGALDAAVALCRCDHVSAVDVSLGEDRKCLIWFSQREEKTLRVTHSSLSCDHLVRLAEIVSDCHGLTKLELRNNSLRSEWVENFVTVLSFGSRRRSVSVEENWITGDGAMTLVRRCLQNCSNIQTIGINHTTLHLTVTESSDPASVSDFDASASSAVTEKISLVDCSIDGRQLSPMKSIVRRCPSLTHLHFSHNSLGVDGVESLCLVLPSLTKLVSFSVVSKETGPTVGEKLSEALTLTPTLRQLNLSGHVISDAAAQTLTGLFPRLTSLNLSHCRWSPSGGRQLVSALARCVALEDLCLDSVKLDENVRSSLTPTLTKLQRLRSLKLNEVVTTEEHAEQLLTAMEPLTGTEEIELDGWRMNDRGVDQLIRLVPVWTRLRKIRLSKNLISDQSGGKLLEALIGCSLLEELYLSSNRLGDVTAAKMAAVLPAMTHITVLDISENVIGRDGAASLSEAIKFLTNLRRIQLTSVGTSELGAVVASLRHCSLVEDVGLGWNNCGDDVALELSRIIPSCQKLTRIDLESNGVGVVGVEALVKALRSSPALQLIRLWRNKVLSSEAQRLRLQDKRLNFSST